MRNVSNYGTSSSDPRQQNEEYRRFRERNWRLELCRYPAIGVIAASVIICLLGVLGLERDRVPLVVLIICFSIGIAGIVICCYCICTYLFRWGRLTRADWLEEQDRRNLRSRIQNPDSPRETEGLFPSNTEGRDQDPDTSSQSEGSGTSSPQIGVQNPGSSHQTRGSFISRYQNPGSSFETAGTLV